MAQRKTVRHTGENRQGTGLIDKLPFSKVVCWKAYFAPFLVHFRLLEGIISEEDDIDEQNTEQDSAGRKDFTTPVITIGPAVLDHRHSPVKNEKEGHDYRADFVISVSSMGLHRLINKTLVAVYSFRVSLGSWSDIRNSLLSEPKACAALITIQRISWLKFQKPDRSRFHFQRISIRRSSAKRARESDFRAQDFLF